MTDIKTEQDRILAVVIAGAIGNISDEHAFRAVTALREAGYMIVPEPTFLDMTDALHMLLDQGASKTTIELARAAFAKADIEIH